MAKYFSIFKCMVKSEKSSSCVKVLSLEGEYEFTPRKNESIFCV